MVVCFVVCNVLCHFERFSDFHVFQYCEKCISKSQLNKTSYQIKSPDQCLPGMVFEQTSQYWLFLALLIHVWALNYVHRGLYLTHI